MPTEMDSYRLDGWRDTGDRRIRNTWRGALLEARWQHRDGVSRWRCAAEPLRFQKAEG